MIDLATPIMIGAVLGLLFVILKQVVKRAQIVPVSEDLAKRGYVFVEHHMEIETDVAFDEATANDLLMQIRNLIHVHKRAYSDRVVNPDSWHIIDQVDYIAHGGGKFYPKENA